MEAENSVLIQFRGWVIDVFETSEPDTRIGITVERAPTHQDNPSVDIFVEQTTSGFKVRSPDGKDTPPLMSSRRSRMLERAMLRQREALLDFSTHDAGENPDPTMSMADHDAMLDDWRGQLAAVRRQLRALDTMA